jgi:hypothetical protein
MVATASSDPLDDLEKIAFVIEADCPAPRCRVVDNFAPEFAVIEKDLVADADFAGGVDDDVPDILFFVQFAEEETPIFALVFFSVEQPRKTCLVLASPLHEVLHDIGEPLVIVIRPVNDHQARGVA